MPVEITGKWKEHFQEVFGQFRPDSAFTDVIFYCGGYQVAAHKAILVSGSALLQRLLKDDSAIDSIILPDISSRHALDLILRVINLGKVEIPSKDVPLFRQLMHILEIRGEGESAEFVDLGNLNTKITSVGEEKTVGIEFHSDDEDEIAALLNLVLFYSCFVSEFFFCFKIMIFLLVYTA
jgi:hypothetical protein